MNGAVVKKERKVNRETYAVSPRNGIDGERMIVFQHSKV